MKHILIISNDSKNVWRLNEVLSTADFKLTDTASGMDGFLLAGHANYTALIVDEDLTDINSFYLCRKICQCYGYPIVLLGNSPPVEVWARAEGLGLLSYLKKPISVHDLAGLLQAFQYPACTGESNKMTSVPAAESMQSALLSPIQVIQEECYTRILN
jgi:DNA-binding response OmpR family regulator